MLSWEWKIRYLHFWYYNWFSLSLTFIIHSKHQSIMKYFYNDNNEKLCISTNLFIANIEENCYPFPYSNSWFRPISLLKTLFSSSNLGLDLELLIFNLILTFVHHRSSQWQQRQRIIWLQLRCNNPAFKQHSIRQFQLRRISLSEFNQVPHPIGNINIEQE